VESIEKHTRYKNYEIVIVDNGSRESQTLHYLASSAHRVMRDDGPFNFSQLCNQAANHAGGEQLLFLNNDMEVITPDWLEAMLEHAQRPDVGAVGAKLLYADNTIQHAGVVFGMRGVAGHAHKYQPAKRSGYGHFPHLIRNYSAVTAACLMIRKAVYESIGGMQEQLAVLYNDADLCVRLRQQGYLIVYTPYAKLYHHEGRSRWSHPPRPDEVQYMLDHWGPLIAQDPYYNPNLVLDREDFSFDIKRARLLASK
jgi:GT2 family glycosyltransferase